MRSTKTGRGRHVRMAGGGILFAAALVSAGTDEPQLFQVHTELGMPNLEDNLRYSAKDEKLCLTEAQLEHRFPALSHPSLSDCRLTNRQQGGGAVSYSLACSGGHGTVGSATWQSAAHQRSGVLNVKLGGKNMTFFERVTATALGTCR
jgi:hypothetical protein